ncbi:MAG TPA: PHP domain-containing protein [Gemmatimonadales bacterium]|nr:PHP domain-containing protein [Gemmatimonadales bacterium]
MPSTVGRARVIDLHCHSTASDGHLAPTDVIRHAAEIGLSAVALTDHDTLGGLLEATAAGEALGIRVIGGCEFSVAAPWGEMHLLGYFLTPGDADIEHFLVDARTDRSRRAREMVTRLVGLGLKISYDDVAKEADGGAVGRPHVARALLRLGLVATEQAAFDKYLGRGRPCFVEKALPTLREVADLVHAKGGIVSAAHLKWHGTRASLALLQADGLDAVETRHPSHDGEVRATITEAAATLGLVRSGGSDWHGEFGAAAGHSMLGSQEVPDAWLDELEARRPVGTPRG